MYIIDEICNLESRNALFLFRRNSWEESEQSHALIFIFKIAPAQHRRKEK